MKLKTLLLSGLAACALAACNSSGDDPSGIVQFTDMMTLTKMSDEGAVLTYVPENDGPNVTYTTTTTFQKDVYKEGMRVVTIYRPLSTDQWGVPGPILVMSAAPALGKGSKPIVAVADTLSDWKSDVIDNVFLWRSGTYMNISFVERYCPIPQKFACYVDAETLESSYPELHIVYKEGVQYEERDYQLYGSFDISDLWNRPSSKGIRVVYNGMNGPTQQFEKMKFQPVG